MGANKKNSLSDNLIIEYNGSSAKGAISLLDSLTKSLNIYCSNNESEEAAGCAIPLIFPFAQSVGYALHHGQQLAHSLPDIDKADAVLKKCVAAGNVALVFFGVLQQPFQNEEIESNSSLVIEYYMLILIKTVTEHILKIKNALRDLDELVHAVTESLKAIADQGNVGEELENELGAMERAIEEAAARIAQLWDNSKNSQTGVKLEVNEKVLDSCTALMKAIVDLIRKAKVLQEEIVARGKGFKVITYFVYELFLYTYFFFRICNCQRILQTKSSVDGRSIVGSKGRGFWCKAVDV